MFVLAPTTIINKMKTSREVAALIKKYIEGNISSLESVRLDQWIKEKPEHEAFFKKLLTDDELFEDALVWVNLNQSDHAVWLEDMKSDTLQKIRNAEAKPIRYKKRTWLYYAAAIVLMLGIGYSFYHYRTPDFTEIDAELSSVLPGSNKAELKLSDGRTINLRSDKDGIVIDQDLEYSDGTPLLAVDKKDLSKIMATINVPKGGKYQIVLPDGSKVWLNSMSKLEYPLAFEPNRRTVKLEGEGYFEVAKLNKNNKRVPFEVISSAQTIEVTGTQFNVSAYPDEAQTISTLVEGSINIHSASGKVSLTPNQQAINTASGLSKRTVDVESFIAWKNNKFMFYETELRDVMKGLSRWYDIQVEYQGNIPATYFYGEIGRDKNLAEVIRLIENSGVKFKLKQKGSTYKLIII